MAPTESIESHPIDPPQTTLDEYGNVVPVIALPNLVDDSSAERKERSRRWAKIGRPLVSDQSPDLITSSPDDQGGGAHGDRDQSDEGMLWVSAPIEDTHGQGMGQVMSCLEGWLANSADASERLQ